MNPGKLKDLGSDIYGEVSKDGAQISIKDSKGALYQVIQVNNRSMMSPLKYGQYTYMLNFLYDEAQGSVTVRIHELDAIKAAAGSAEPNLEAFTNITIKEDPGTTVEPVAPKDETVPVTTVVPDTQEGDEEELERIQSMAKVMEVDQLKYLIDTSTDEANKEFLQKVYDYMTAPVPAPQPEDIDRGAIYEALKVLPAELGTINNPWKAAAWIADALVR